MNMRLLNRTPENTPLSLVVHISARELPCMLCIDRNDSFIESFRVEHKGSQHWGEFFWDEGSSLQVWWAAVQEFEHFHVSKMVKLCFRVCMYFFTVGIQVQIQMWVTSKDSIFNDFNTTCLRSTTKITFLEQLCLLNCGNHSPLHPNSASVEQDICIPSRYSDKDGVFEACWILYNNWGMRRNSRLGLKPGLNNTVENEPIDIT